MSYRVCRFKKGDRIIVRPIKEHGLILHASSIITTGIFHCEVRLDNGDTGWFYDTQLDIDVMYYRNKRMEEIGISDE